jgi:acetyltransferase-like isoleucine patch superfamily enzyme
VTVLEHDWFPRPLPDGVQIGDRSWLYSSYAFHHNRGRVRIGADCGVYNGTQFELGPDGEAEIEDFCTVVGAIIATDGRVRIGHHTFIAHEVVIATSPFALPPGAGGSGLER